MEHKSGSAEIEDIIDRTRARLLYRAGDEPGAISVYQDDRYRWLENGNGTLQSMMDRRAPERLVLPYTMAMMAGLLFIEAPKSVLMLGLGGGSQLRFLRNHFTDARITALESNAGVIDVARTYFGVPDEDGVVSIVNEDVHTNITVDEPCTDLILVDLFDAGGLPPWVRSKSLHEYCRRRLDRNGVQVTNLWVDADDEFLEVMDGVQKTYEERTLILDVPEYRNLIVLSFKCTPCLDFASLSERALALGERTGIDYTAWLSRMRESNLSDEEGFVI